MKLRRLNLAGVEAFRRYLETLTLDPKLQPPTQILTDEESSEPLSTDVEIEAIQFANRFEAAKYLDQRLSGLNVPNLERDKGIWSWLSLFYFDQLCAKGRNGVPKPGELARWIPATDDFRKYYRHLLAGPYRVFRAHREVPERAMSLLDGLLSKPGEIAEQVASSQEFVTNPAIVGLATQLYLNKDLSRKRGSGGKGPGSPRRLAAFLNQLVLTYDLYSLTLENVTDMLPKEFSRFVSV